MPIEQHQWNLSEESANENSYIAKESLNLLQHIFDTYELDEPDADAIEQHLKKFKSE